VIRFRTTVLPSSARRGWPWLSLRASRRCSLPVLGLLLLAAQAAPPKLGETWPQGNPEEFGLSAVRLEGAWRVLELNRTNTFLVIRSDHVVFERYAAGFGRSTPHYTASLAKALVGGLGLLAAQSEGYVRPTDPASRYIPAWRDDPRKGQITLAHLATHTSGLDDANEDGVAHRDLTGWKGDFWKRLPPPRDPYTLAFHEVPLLFAPGERAHYSNPGIAALGYALAAGLRGSPYADLNHLIRDRILRPIGVPDAEWSAGYDGPVKQDGLALIGPWGGANFSPNAAARVGRLLARRGDWDENQIIPFELAASATRHAGLPNFSGLAWWVNRRADGSRVLANAPEDAFWGLGAGGQLLFVAPSLDLIVVRNGTGLPAGVDTLRMMERLVINPVLDAFTRETKPPYPPSPVIGGIRWGPADTIIRLAPGSDNWPSTWGDDDHLYVSYGDGNGFTPFVPEKLSLGFARIAGMPPALSPANLRTADGEQHGDGRSGRKASGLLMIDGTLYLLVRNAGNAQLAWSDDRGITWKWSDWKFTTSFGCPAFVNFGANYAGARDDYVYLVSPDADTAYQRADRLVMARVPKDKLREAGAYEYFVQRNAQGVATWCHDIAQRGGILENPAACYRSHITYNPGLKRYLLTTIGRGADTRYAGGFGVFDAPAPWGPWTTVFYTDTWDVGPGESNHFPAKWLDVDGRGGWLLFSGDDAFSVRRAEFLPAAAAAK
jgi:CubicO group peptidase (beta-lactamase class C family)